MSFNISSTTNETESISDKSFQIDLMNKNSKSTSPSSPSKPNQFHLKKNSKSDVQLFNGDINIDYKKTNILSLKNNQMASNFSQNLCSSPVFAESHLTNRSSIDTLFLVVHGGIFSKYLNHLYHILNK